MHQDIDTHTSGRNRGTRDLLNDAPINAFRGAHVRAGIKTEGTIKAHQTTIFVSKHDFVHALFLITRYSFKQYRDGRDVTGTPVRFISEGRRDALLSYDHALGYFVVTEKVFLKKR